MSVTHELLMRVKADDDLKELIGQETTQLKDFCWSIGLLVR